MEKWDDLEEVREGNHNQSKLYEKKIYVQFKKTSLIPLPFAKMIIARSITGKEGRLTGLAVPASKCVPPHHLQLPPKESTSLETWHAPESVQMCAGLCTRLGRKINCGRLCRHFGSEIEF